MRNPMTKKPAAALAGIAALACALALPAMCAGEPADHQSDATRAGMLQGDVKRDSAAILSRMIELRDQMRQLMPDDVAAVDRAIQTMQALSRDEMEGAVAALQDASRSKDAAEQVGKIVAALKIQGVVSASLKKLSVDLQARETLAGLAAEITAIIRREVSAFLEIGRLGKIQQKPANFRGRDMERFQVAKEDQKGITADLNLLSRKIETLARDLADNPHKGLAQAAAIPASQKLPESAVLAERFTASGPLNDAGAAQAQIIRILIAMKDALASDPDPAARLRELSARLESVGSDQKEVMDAVLLIGDKRDLSRNFKLMQARLGDELVAVRFEIEPLNNLAAGQLLAAGDFVDKALLNFNRMKEEHMDARTNTGESHRAILVALQMLKEQLAKLEATKPRTAAELAAELDQLQREVAMAAAQQAQAAKQPQVSPSQQQAMQARANAFQQRALPISPSASQKLGDAANQISNPTPESQAAAAQALADAAQELNDQRKEVAALAAADAALAKAQELTDKARQDLENKQTAAAANDLNAAKQVAEAAQKSAAQSSPAAAEAMGQAAQDLAQAEQAAAQTKTESAMAKTGSAAAAMAEARSGLAQAMAQTPGMPGMGQGMTPGAGQGNSPGQDAPNSKGNGGGGGGGDNLIGSGADSEPVRVIEGLNAKERDAITQLQKEKPPAGFGPEVQQYYKNIADGAGL